MCAHNKGNYLLFDFSQLFASENDNTYVLFKTKQLQYIGFLKKPHTMDYFFKDYGWTLNNFGTAARTLISVFT